MLGEQQGLEFYLHLNSVTSEEPHFTAHISSDPEGAVHPPDIQKVVYNFAGQGLVEEAAMRVASEDSMFAVIIDSTDAVAQRLSLGHSPMHMSVDVYLEDHIAKAVFKGNFPQMTKSHVHQLRIPQACSEALTRCKALLQTLGGSNYFEPSDERVIALFQFLQVSKQIERIVPEADYGGMVRYAGVCRAVTDYDPYNTPSHVPRFVPMRDQVTLSVFIEGTSRDLAQAQNDRTAVLGNLYRACDAVKLDTNDHNHSSMASNEAYLKRISTIFAKSQLERNDRMFKIGFNGCSTRQGWFGVDDVHPTVHVITARVSAMLEGREELDVRVNVLGFSRGGVTAIILAKHLNNLEHAKRVSVNLALVDPVPGDSECDEYAGDTLTAEAADLSHCHVIEKVLTLYAEDPTRHYCARWLFKPLVPRYPAQCSLEIDVIPGEHSTWQGIKEKEHNILLESGGAALAAFYRLKDFLHSVNTRFSSDWSRHFGCSAEEFPTELQCIQRMTSYLDQCNATGRKQSRNCHFGCRVVRHQRAAFLNKHHEQLCLRHKQLPELGSHEPFVRCWSLQGVTLSKPSFSSKYTTIEQIDLSCTSTGLITEILPGDLLHSISRNGKEEWQQFGPGPSSSQLKLQELQEADEDQRGLEFVFYRWPRQGHRYLLRVEFDGAGPSPLDLDPGCDGEESAIIPMVGDY